MARGVNKVIIVGNCGQDPETRFMPSGGAVTNLSIATSESWKDKNTGDQQERTEWHRVVFFNRLAEIAGEYVKKGSKLYVEGSLRTRKWQGRTVKIVILPKLSLVKCRCWIVEVDNRQGGWEIIRNNLHLSNSKLLSSNKLPSSRRRRHPSVMMKFLSRPQ